MAISGRKNEIDEVFVSQSMIAAKAMNAAPQNRESVSIRLCYCIRHTLVFTDEPFSRGGVDWKLAETAVSRFRRDSLVTGGTPVQTNRRGRFLIKREWVPI
jgi:hypothetical protein